MVALTLTHLTQPGSSIQLVEIPTLYEAGCWFAGTGMIAVSVASSIAGVGSRSGAASMSVA